MEKLQNPNCPKCGEIMGIKYIPSSGMDVQPTGMFANCYRCGYKMKISSLDEQEEMMKKVINNLTN